tara:strand:+ start:1734 stop:1949 length:216 start_codon:yes stop_codon:yes gene_type:complete
MKKTNNMAEYSKIYQNEEKKIIEKYKIKIKMMTSDLKVIVDLLNKAESVVKLIANTYHLPEAEGYFNDTPQ